MSPILDRLLSAQGVSPRQFRALVRAMLLKDLRGRHFSKATGVKPTEMIGPMLLVVLQCILVSAASSAFLFLRVDVFFFALVHIGASMAITLTTMIVEFQEVVFDPGDLEVLGPRPISPRTYAAARFTNLAFYVLAMWLGMNITPAIVGAGLPDAGALFLPAYALASLSGSLATVAIGVVLLSTRTASGKLGSWQEILAFAQIALIVVVGYGVQLLLHDRTPDAMPAFLRWAAFPPAWVDWLPPAWLARFVERVSTSPSNADIGRAIGIAAAAVACVVVALIRLTQVYRTMQPVVVQAISRPMPTGQLGGLGRRSWWLHGKEEHVGYWLGRTFLLRDGDLRLRSLLPLNIAVVAMFLGVATGQFENPMRRGDPKLILLPILGLYTIALAAPTILYNFSFSRNFDAIWLLRSAPLAQPGGVGRGIALAVFVWLILPMVLLYGASAAICWRDPVAVALHLGLALVLGWAASLAGLAIVLRDFPLSRPASIGGSLGPVAIPMAFVSLPVLTLAGVHMVAAGSVWFWIGSYGAAVLISIPLGRTADRRMQRLWRT